MAAFDTSLTPVAETPTGTSPEALDPGNTADAFIYLDIANIGTDPIEVTFGITPDGGSLQTKGFEVVLAPNDGLLGLGPWYIQAGDVVTVQTDTADDAVFSLTGVESS